MSVSPSSINNCCEGCDEECIDSFRCKSSDDQPYIGDFGTDEGSSIGDILAWHRRVNGEETVQDMLYAQQNKRL